MHKTDNAQTKVGPARCAGRTPQRGVPTIEYDRMTKALDLVAAERVRQRALLADGVILDDCSDPKTPHETALRILSEEHGEVALATNQLLDLIKRAPNTAPLSGRLIARLKALRAEYIQTAAVAVARVEALNQLEGMGDVRLP